MAMSIACFWLTVDSFSRSVAPSMYAIAMNNCAPSPAGASGGWYSSMP
jgi:hypothetical protein